MCYSTDVARKITQRELRNDSGAVMRALDRGESFVVTRNGVPVGELHPIRHQEFVAADLVAAVFSNAPPVDLSRLRADLDAVVDQTPAPRA